MIKFENVYLKHTKHFDTLSDINVHIENKNKVVILGDSDSGKNSLVRLIVGLEKPTTGTITLNSTPVNQVDFKDVSVGFLSSKPVFLNTKTVKQNLQYILKIRQLPDNEIDELVKLALKKYDLLHIAETKISKLKMYEKIIVAVARLDLRELDLLVLEDVTELRYFELNKRKTFKDKNKESFNKALDVVYSNDEKEYIESKITLLLDKNKNSTIIMCENNDKFALDNGYKIVKLNYGSIEE